MTWVDIPAGSDFPIENLPYGAFSTAPGGPARIGVAIGDHVLDLAPALDDPVFGEPTLNGFLAQGRSRWSAVRARVTDLLTEQRQQRCNAGHRELRPFHLHVDHFHIPCLPRGVARVRPPSCLQRTPVWPNPPAPRALSSNVSTTCSRARTIGSTTSWAMRSPGCIVKASLPRFHTLIINGPW